MRWVQWLAGVQVPRRPRGAASAPQTPRMPRAAGRAPTKLVLAASICFQTVTCVAATCPEWMVAGGGCWGAAYVWVLSPSWKLPALAAKLENY